MNIEPKMRDASDWNLRKIVEELKKGIDGKGMMKSCLSCQHFDEASEQCKQFQQRPPARVIAYSCPAYVDLDEIPF